MKKILLLTAAAIMMLAAPARSQDAPESSGSTPNFTATKTPPQITEPAPAPPPTPGKFYIEIDQADLVAIGTALAELPKKIADPLILKLNGQLNPQAQAQIKANSEAAAKAAGDAKVPLPKPRPGKRD